MKLLLDENLPHKLRSLLPGHDCFTVTFMKWNGISNGELLRLASANGFDAFISTDRGLEYGQNPAALPVAVVVIMAMDNKLQTLETAVPQLLLALSKLTPGQLVKITAEQ